MDKQNDAIVEIKDEDIKEEDFSPEELEADTTDWKAKALELKGIAKRRATQLAKAKEKLANVKPEPKPEPQDKKIDNKKPDDKLSERLDKMALQIAGINEADEVELFNKWKNETGRESDSIVQSSIFKKELEDLRVAKANQHATSNVRGEPGGTGGTKNTPEYWISKATKGADGKPMFPEEMPKELYSKVLGKLSDNEPNSSEALKFHNQ